MTAEAEGVGILESKKGHYATISGVTFHIMDSVDPFIQRTPVNTEVYYKYRTNKSGGKSITLLKKNTNGSGFKTGNEVKQGNIASGSSSPPDDGLTEFQRAEKAMAEKEGREWKLPQPVPPPAGSHQPGANVAPPKDPETLAAEPDRQKLIVLQSVLKVCANMYQVKPVHGDNFEAACDRIWVKTIDLTEKLFTEARR